MNNIDIQIGIGTIINMEGHHQIIITKHDHTLQNLDVVIKTTPEEIINALLMQERKTT